MSYIVAGWSIGLGVVAAYAATLVVWRRRLTRAVARADEGAAPGGPA